MKDSILQAIGDVLIIDVVPKINGRIQFTEYSDVWEGITDERTVNKEFRVSADGVFWSNWLIRCQRSIHHPTPIYPYWYR